MAHEDQFTATGPAFTGSGFPRAGFSTNRAGADFIYGVNVQGERCGVYGESVKGGSGKRESDVEGVGIHGFGENFGVYGNGTRGIAGVYGGHSRGGIGVLGAAMRGATAVVGVSMASIGNPLSTFRDGMPNPPDGSGVGVFGASGTGAGVRGTSDEGNGGAFSSNAGDGVFGQSNSGSGVTGFSESGVGVAGVSGEDRGGVFKSGENVAQIRLAPQRQRTRFPQLPRSGKVGDMIMIRHRASRIRIDGSSRGDDCSLWLCIPKDSSDDSDQWREVMLGQAVTGSV